MSYSRILKQVGVHFQQNRYKYVTLISVAAVMLVEAAKAARTIDGSSTRKIDTSEGKVEVVDWRGAYGDITFDQTLSKNCAEYSFYRDLCALFGGFKFSMKIDSNFEMSESNNQAELVETGKSAVCIAARHFAKIMGITETEACNQLPDVGIKLR